MKKRYEQLIEAFCSAASFGATDRIIAGDPFEADGMTFALAYDSHAMPGKVLIYTDFGPMPAHDNKAIYYSLLEENFLGAMGKGGSFSLSSVTGNIVYIESFSIDEATPKTLYEKLARLSKEAKEWRVTHYIGDVAKQPSRPRGSASHSMNRNFSVRN